MSKQTVLVIEDEQDIRELLHYNLSREGFHVVTANTGEQGLQSASSHTPDAIILDLMLPGVDGMEICRRLRRDNKLKQTPVIMLTAKNEEADMVSGLEVGADDYVTKPFSPRVVVARVKAVLRRGELPERGEDEVLVFDNLSLYPGRHEVLVNNAAVPMTHSEFKILHHMARRPGWVFTRYQLVDAVHGEKHAVSDRSVDVLIVGLRRKLATQGFRIETVRGVGYRFQA